MIHGVLAGSVGDGGAAWVVRRLRRLSILLGDQLRVALFECRVELIVRLLRACPERSCALVVEQTGTTTRHASSHGLATGNGEQATGTGDDKVVCEAGGCSPVAKHVRKKSAGAQTGDEVIL